MARITVEKVFGGKKYDMMSKNDNIIKDMLLFLEFDSITLNSCLILLILSSASWLYP